MVALLALSTNVQASTLINFEDQAGAPCCWPGVDPLNLYLSQGVQFNGSNWKILDQSGNFGVSGHSAPKFLAWGSTPSWTEVLTFPSAVTAFSVRVGSPSGQTMLIRAYNSSGVQIASNSVVMSSTMATLSVGGSGIYRVELQVSPASGYGVSDDFRFDRQPIPALANTSGFRNTAVSFNASASTDADGGVSGYQIDCTGDGTYDFGYGTPTFTSCSYPSLGTYTPRLRVYDTDGYFSESYATASVTISNRLPTAVANGPYSGYRNTPIAMSGAGSSDADGSISKYEWDCTNDGTYDVSGASSSLNCTYTALGTFTARLRVTDNDNGTSTSTSTVTINNRLPTPVANGPYSGYRNTPVAMSAAGSTDADGTITKYEWDCTNDGTYEVSGTTPTLNCTYTALGTFTARLRVTDNNSSTATTTATVTISNRVPVAEANGPYTGATGSPIAVTGVGSTDQDGTITKYEWDCNNDGTFEFSGTTPTGTSCTYAVNGAYTVALRVTDNNNATATDFATVGVNSVPPVAEANGPYTGNRNVAVALSSAGSKDNDGTITKYEWDCTSDGTYDVTNGTGTGLTCTYPAVGSYTARLRVTDNQALTGIDTATVTINAIAPTADAAGPYTGNEGSPVSVDASGSKDTDGTVTAWAWDCNGDGTYETNGKTANCTFADDGSYTVGLRVTDDDGKTAVDSASVTIANVAPTISTTAGTTALEGDPYVYDADATDPGSKDKHTWALVSGPADATIDPDTGVVDWTPDYGDAIVGGAPFEISVTDGGATVNQSFNVFVTARDDDNDDLWDGWELQNSLDPADPTDAAEDPDKDGLTNLDEFVNKQNPFSYDGPSIPTPSTPINGQDASSSPSLIVENASDPQGEDLTYEFEIYDDPDMNVLLATEAGVVEGSFTTEWLVTVSLFENDSYYWRARAADDWVDGGWSPLVQFRVNDVNEAPADIVQVYPVAESVDVDAPTLEWAQTTDPEGDQVTYDVEVRDSTNTTVASATGLVLPPPSNPTWTVDTALDDGDYTWRVLAKDAVGVASQWTQTTFTVNTDEDAPTGIAFTDPLDEDRVDSVSPVLSASEGTDADGSVITYKFEVDGQNTFDSSQYETVELPATGTGTVSWDLADDSIELDENTYAYARVRGIDAFGNASPPDTVRFFVVGLNEAPVGLTLQSPLDGTLLDVVAPFVVSNAVDPEGLAVTYDFVIASDQELTDVLDSATGVAQGESGTTTWESSASLTGEVWWSARAVDGDGVASDYAPAWRLEVGGPDDTDTNTEDPGKCGCGSGSGAANMSGFALAGVLALLVRRRTRATTAS